MHIKIKLHIHAGLEINLTVFKLINDILLFKYTNIKFKLIYQLKDLSSAELYKIVHVYSNTYLFKIH